MVYFAQEGSIPTEQSSDGAANENAPLGLRVEVVPVPFCPGHWLVEAVDEGSEGEVYRATFDGCDAENRARRYAETLSTNAVGTEQGGVNPNLPILSEGEKP